MKLEDIKKREKKETKLGLVFFVCFTTFVLFPFGILIEYDAFSIIVHKNEYHSGVLKGDSVSSIRSRYGSSSTVYFFGNADTVSTWVMIGDKKSHDSNTVKALHSFRRLGYFEHPVWYRPDGEFTLKRYKHEKQFPIERITLKAFWIFIFMILPFLTSLVWFAKVKIHLNRLKALEPPRERWLSQKRVE